MAVTIYYENDVDPKVIQGKKIAVIGYGSQGHAHALNLMDSGCDVRVGLREGSSSWAKAEEAGLKVTDMDTAAEEADLIMILVPDETQPKVYEEHIAPHLKAGDTLAFAHGLTLHASPPPPRPEAPALHYNIFGPVGRLSPRGAQGFPTCRIHPTIVPEMRCAAPKRRNFPARKRYGRHKSGCRDGHTK